MLFHAWAPKNLWLEAFLTAVYLINRLPSSTIGMDTPFFKLHGVHPDYNSLKTSGCRCFPYLRDYAKNKFEPKSYPCIFLGYNPTHKGYRCLHPPTKRVYLSRHVVFDESVLPYTDPTLLFSSSTVDACFSTYADCVTGFLSSKSSPTTTPKPSQSVSFPPIVLLSSTPTAANTSHIEDLLVSAPLVTGNTSALSQPSSPATLVQTNTTYIRGSSPNRTT